MAGGQAAGCDRLQKTAEADATVGNQPLLQLIVEQLKQPAFAR